MHCKNVNGARSNQPRQSCARRWASGWAIVVVLALFSPPAASSPKRLTLADAMARARNNPLAHAAGEQRRAAEARLSEARGARFPRAELTSFIAPSPEIRCRNTDCTRTDPRDPLPSFDGVFGGFRVTVAQPLYTFGKISAAIDAAGSAVGANDALAAGVSADLTLDTARAYFGLALARELARMLDDGSRRIDRGKQGLDERLERGDAEVTVQDRLRLETFRAEVLLRLSEAREGEAQALSTLRALVGDPEADIVDAPFEPFDYALADAKSYLSRAQASRPELRAAREGVAALEGTRRMERARLLPDVLLVGGMTLARAQGVDDPPSAFANDPFNTTTGEVALVMRWSIDPGGQLARIERADAELGRARALFAAATRASDAVVLQAYTRAREAKTRLATARAGEKSARGWVASVMQADAVGTTTAKDLADAYLAYFTLHGRVLSSIYDWNVAVMTLKRLLGEPPLHVPQRSSNPES